MKRILVMLSIGILMLAACGNDKYVDKIDKAVKMQDQKQEQMAKNDTGDKVKHFDKKDANIYVYENGKYVVLAYKPLSNNEEVHYYTYQFDGKKAKRIDNFDTKQYIESHDADYKEENMN
ncbi:DUF4467 domain-containing protein [Staphylococcus haemolyticus]|uniref:DUF4467 domain-containing protein n=1 Tax=Staphylococcus haemolyticus TaxID=1283 RepID=UPI00070779E1|nr:DUF4467 domain-containing protein [Staphylococcus haemolyticus]KQC19121.1 hypothetical protein SHTS_03975 [Staphylococcus haemolyticus]PNY84448.1 cystatin-like fold lipoprotein [Staphylococcus haemolyticus]QCY37711.1 DUF4467 domain-containing protein [Staphylococcus haemolyticus]QXA65032.1 DUF4467 domain-containing protein [Staphylococcus haemolyticus]SUM38421.1 putative lipoprotein [Staphylococcus haemolyticus]